MDGKDFRILGLAASLRQASIHRGIIRAAHEVAPEWMVCEGFDLGTIPYFNQDVEDRGNPEPVRELREKIRAYDAVLIATPEYDYAIPGVLTAALDWCLRSRLSVGWRARGPPKAGSPAPWQRARPQPHLCSAGASPRASAPA